MIIYDIYTKFVNTFERGIDYFQFSTKQRKKKMCLLQIIIKSERIMQKKRTMKRILCKIFFALLLKNIANVYNNH